MKKILLFFILILISSNIIGQAIAFTFVDFSNDAKYRLNSFIDVDETSFYISSINKKEKPYTYFLEKRDKLTGKIIFEVKLNYKPYYSYCNGNNIVVIYSELYGGNKSSKSVRDLSCSFFSALDGSKIQDKNLEEIRGQKIGPFINDYRIVLSPDKSKILMIPNTNSADFQNNEAEIKNPKMYDARTLDVIWQLSDNLKIDGNLTTINNKGDIFWPTKAGVAIVRFESDKRRDIQSVIKKPQYFSTAIIHFSDDGQIIMTGIFKEVSINPDAKLKDGFVEDKDFVYGKIGFYFSKINLVEFKFENERVEYINSELEKKLTWQDELHNIGKTPAEKMYKAVNLIKENGAVYFVAEHCLDYTLGMNVVHAQHELIVVKFLLTGTIEWTKILPRSSEEETIFVFYNESLNFVFLENKKNMALYTLDNYVPEKIYTAERFNDKSETVCITIDKNGIAKRKSVSINFGHHLFFQDKNLLLSKDKLLIYTILENATKLSTLKFY